MTCSKILIGKRGVDPAWLRDFIVIYRLDRYAGEIVTMEGCGRTASRRVETPGCFWYNPYG
jgi:hypothetical protein